MARRAFRPAVPPPTITCRFLAMFAVCPPPPPLPARLPSGGYGAEVRGRPLGREGAQPVGRLGLLVEDGLGRADLRAGRAPAAQVALERLLGLAIEKDSPMGAGDSA